MIERRKTRTINVGSIPVGSDYPVSIQSMTKTDTRDSSATVAQIQELAKYGCDIVRVAIPDKEAASKLPEIIENSPIPVIADIHFDYRLALDAVSAGVHGIRINPGNIGKEKEVRTVAEAAGEAGISIRVGSNSGSLPKGLLESLRKSSENTEEAFADALVQSASDQCGILEKYGFKDIKVSLKSSDMPVALRAYRKFAAFTDYPLHLGITEAGTLQRGTVKSSIGIGVLLLEGIGDTLRVSLTASPVEEVKTGVMILESVGLRIPQPEIISCPTCGRTEIDLFKIIEKVEKEVAELKRVSGKNLNIRKIAVMGCIVNGPGEAKDAELGIAGGRGKVAIFRHGELIGTFPEQNAFEVFRKELFRFLE